VLHLGSPAAVEADRHVEDRRWLAVGGVLAGTCLGVALQLSNGILVPRGHPLDYLSLVGLTLVAVALALTAGSAVMPRPARLARMDARVVPLLGLAALAIHLGFLYTSLPAIYLRRGADALTTFQSGVAVLAIVCASTAWSRPRWARPLQIVALVTAHAALGVWIIHHSPKPAIDVHLFQRYAIDALRSGVDPYAITFPDIYQGTVYYGSGLSVDGRLQFGYPYFPFTLLLSMPGQILFKDPRFAQLIAIELAALLMTFARPKGLGLMAAALYLTTPRTFFVLEQSWTEPFLVLGVSALVFAACRRSRLTPWLFGAFLALKQYLVLALPAAWLLLEAPRDSRRLLAFLTRAAIVGAVLTLPFVLWNPAAFWRSVVTLQFHQPFRPDALSVLSWWASRGHEPPSALISFVVAAAASIVALWRLPRTPAGFAMAIAVTFFGFFAFNKQAFANYYFFVVGALYATVAAWRPPEAGE
jgi:hypothetical protein